MYTLVRGITLIGLVFDWPVNCIYIFKVVTMKILAILLVVSGVLMFIFFKPEPEYNQHVGKIDGVEITTKDKTPLHWSPFVGTTLIITGTLLLIATHESSKYRQKEVS